MKKENEKIAVLIPAYNEEITIEKVVKDFQAALPKAEIYVYDNNSKDKTSELAKSTGAHVVFECRQGKGNVVRSMFKNIYADYYIMVDADDTYPANEVEKLLEPMRNGFADMVIGDRLSNGTYSNENKRVFHGLGNNIVKNLINKIYDGHFEDIMTGYRGFTQEFVKTFPVTSAGFEIETEMSIHAMDKHFRLVEVPITYRDRPEGSESKLNTYADGFRVLKTIFQFFKSYRPMFFFGIISLFFFILSFVVGIPVIAEYFETGFIHKVPSSILATGLMLLGAISLMLGLALDSIAKTERKEYELFSNLIKIQLDKNKK
ncbi:MAG: glycosyltransferase family 2 protein [Streptococcaceae bacterium]|nr:glycosyltransferase family 2 protein [Streptococcaceae bacterium]